MTNRSPSEARRSVPPEPRGLRGRGGERPFSNCESARSAANRRERGSEMSPEDFGRSKCGQIRGTPENMQADVLGSEKGHLPFEKRRLRGTCPSFTVIAIDSFLK